MIIPNNMAEVTGLTSIRSQTYKNICWNWKIVGRDKKFKVLSPSRMWKLKRKLSPSANPQINRFQSRRRP